MIEGGPPAGGGLATSQRCGRIPQRCRASARRRGAKAALPSAHLRGPAKNPPRTGDKRRALPYPRPGRAKAPSGAFERLRSLFLDFHC
jgi:hypothetical protein